eukprot:TRINITY_DN7449_c0_g1_i4.p1 TRINITY_DN7449_c0_g1~~TRINITY_DN7449_c0_g1_i4.p1  ORF type:complete len:285 (+),score=10.02 TRINITY_DN7449_c0_g1_i4:35-889(+)
MCIRDRSTSSGINAEYGAFPTPENVALAEQLYQYLPWEQHLIELFFVNLIGWGGVYFLIKKYPKRNLEPSKKFSTPLSIIEKILLINLIISYLCNLYYKGSLGLHYLTNMTFPCHVLTLIYIILLSSKSFKITHFLWNTMVFLTHNTLLALSLPDTSDVRFPFQMEVFYLQHISLLFAPLLFLWNDRFKIDRTDTYFFWMSIFTVTLFHYDVHLILGLIFKVNVNYLVWPPPNIGFFIGRFYRLKLMIALQFAMWVSGYVKVWVFLKIKKVIQGYTKTIDNKRE